MTTAQAQGFLERLAAVAAAAALMYVAFRTAHVLLLLFAGLLFGVLLRAMAIPFSRYLGHAWAVSTAAALFFGFFAIVTIIAGPTVTGGLSQLPQTVPAAMRRLSDISPLAGRLADQVIQSGAFPSGDLLQRIAGVFSTTLGALASLLVILVMGLYVAAEPHTYERGTVVMIPPHWRERAHQVLGLLDQALRWWLLGRFISMIVVGLLTWIGLLLLGLPFAGLLALIAGLFSFVPNLGPILSALPAVLVGLGQGGTTALWVVGIYLGVQTLESYAITPLIQRKTVLIPPALLFGMQLIIGSLFGVLGLLVATPLTVCTLVLIKSLWLDDALGERMNPL